MRQIKYRAGYKYIVAEDYTVQVAIRPAADIETDYLRLTTDGMLTLRKGYASDGPSGPTLDDKSNMRGGFVHDGLYQLIRLGLLPESDRQKADKELERICEEDGMCDFRAWYYYEGVHLFASGAAKCGSDPYPIQTAP